jgi:hypothetical protein
MIGIMKKCHSMQEWRKYNESGSHLPPGLPELQSAPKAGLGTRAGPWACASIGQCPVSAADVYVKHDFNHLSLARRKRNNEGGLEDGAS